VSEEASYRPAPLSEAQERALEEIRKEMAWSGEQSTRNRFVRYIRRGRPVDVLPDGTGGYDGVVHDLKHLFRVLGRTGLSDLSVALIERAEALQEATGERWPDLFFSGIVGGGDIRVLKRYLVSPMFKMPGGAPWMNLSMDNVIAQDNPEIVELLIPLLGPNFSVANSMGSSIGKAGAGRLLRWAVEKHGLDPRKSAWPPRPIQVQAAVKMKAEDYRWLLETWNLDVAVTTRSGTTAAHAAAEADRPDLLAILLERGADLEARDSEGDTPLLKAAATGSLGSLAFLGTSGSNLRARNFCGEDILLRLARGITCRRPGRRSPGSSSVEGWQDASALVDAAWPTLEALGADPLTRDADGRTAVNLVLMARVGSWKPNDPQEVEEAAFFVETARRLRARGVPFLPVLASGHDEVRDVKFRYGEETARAFAVTAALAVEPGRESEGSEPVL
jgi:hypothetical protein